jgi:phospholipid/cholesterol/gamma-HCH transport system substrate-binding protein
VTARVPARRMLAVACCVMLATTGCAFNGLTSLPLPGAVGRGPGADIYHVEIASVGTMEPNSPVLIDDVVVGSVGRMTVKAWHADVEVSVKHDVVVPANAVATVGQTSLLGSTHLELNPPPGQSGSGRLKPGATIPLNKSSTYPSTEQTLSSLSVIINAGGFTQIGDIIHNFSAALSGNAGAVRDLLVRLDRFVGTLDQQRDNLVASIQGLNRLADTLAGQRDVITAALRKIPAALDVLIAERPRLITALDKLRVFSDTTHRLVNDAGADLVKNLQNLEPTIRALADVGPDLGQALAYVPTLPFNQDIIDRAVRGDYTNGFFTADLTNAALRRSLLLGTHWGRLGAELIPAPGDPYYLQYQYTPDPFNPSAPGPVAPPVGAPLTPTAAPAPTFGAPLPPVPVGVCGAHGPCPAAGGAPPRPIPPLPPGPGAPPGPPVAPPAAQAAPEAGPGPMPPYATPPSDGSG